MARKVIVSGASSGIGRAICEKLLEDGHQVVGLRGEHAADQVILGSDFCRRRHLQAEGGPGLVHLVTGFRALAEAEGVPTEVLDQCMIDNAAAMLAIQ